MNAYFEEKQQFTQWWLWLIIGTTTFGVNAALIYGLVSQVYFGIPMGEEALTDESLIIMTLVTVSATTAIALLFLHLILEVRVERGSLEYRFKPLLPNWKSIERESIEEYRVRKYSFRGYGIGRGLDGVRTINVKGNQGLDIRLTDGSRLLIGTQQPEALRQAMEMMMNRNPE